MKKKAVLAASIILMIGLSSAITINIDIFNFGGDEEEANKSDNSQNTTTDPTPGRDTTVEEQEKVDPSSQRQMDDNTITGGDEKQGLGSQIINLLSGLL
ncbi:hypothetical protein [Candidatus Nanohalovita haloferacivicina]|uniref:hypothetical protein n=1 Tax=Candidatus Nanohalovita haloferacivicina TaxID=2978046 RepID=UPI00325FCAF5|nr:hypothetical protein HBNXNv_0678 [Candidatus Nanohalobia archaeon BNXNv]